MLLRLLGIVLLTGFASPVPGVVVLALRVQPAPLRAPRRQAGGAPEGVGGGGRGASRAQSTYIRILVSAVQGPGNDLKS